MTIDSEGEGPPVVMLHGLGEYLERQDRDPQSMRPLDADRKSMECGKLLSEFVRGIPV